MENGQGFSLKLGLSCCKGVKPGAESCRWDLHWHSAWDQRSV